MIDNDPHNIDRKDMNKFTVILALFATALVASVPLTSSALLERVGQTVHQTTEQILGNTKKIRENANIPEEVQAKRQEIQNRVAEKRLNVTEKLSGERAAACEQKEARINEMLAQRTEAAQRHFDTFKSIQDKLSAFVAEKQLNVDNYQALQLIMIDAETSAQGSIDAAKTTTFTCEATDSQNPGKIITEQTAAQKEALKEYRSSIKEYASAIKSAAANADSDGEARNE